MRSERPWRGLFVRSRVDEGCHGKAMDGKPLNKPVKQHFISKFILSGFCNKNGQCWIFDKKTNKLREAKPSNIVTPDLHTMINPHEEIPAKNYSLEFERSKLENKAAPIIRKLRKLANREKQNHRGEEKFRLYEKEVDTLVDFILMYFLYLSASRLSGHSGDLLHNQQMVFQVFLALRDWPRPSKSSEFVDEASDLFLFTPYNRNNEFIIGDSPTKFEYLRDDNSITDMGCPIAHNLYILFSKRYDPARRIGILPMEEQRIMALNSEIFDKSARFVISKSKEILEKIK